MQHTGPKSFRYSSQNLMAEQARKCRRAGQLKKAVKTYEQALKLKYNKKILLELAICYQKIYQYSLSEQTFKKIRHWEQDKQALLGMGYLYEITMSDGALMKVIHFGKHHQFFYCVHFYLIMARYYDRYDDAKIAENILLEAKECFPYSTLIALSLVHFYLQRPDNASVRWLVQKYKKQYYSSHKFIIKLDLLIKYHAFEGLINLDEVSKKTLLTVNLPYYIFDRLQEFEELDECYLVGSSVLKLINNDYNNQCDIDLVVKGEGADKQLQEKGYFRSPYISGLYTKYVYGMFPSHIDVMQTEFRGQDWIWLDALKRDFTMCALFCDKNGHIFDPTGKGIEDAKNYCLRTIVSPVLSLQEDPIRVLRAIKYFCRGYIPAPNLDIALRTWEPNYNIHQLSRVLATITNHFQTEDRVQYINYLHEYGLSDKIHQIFMNYHNDLFANILAQEGYYFYSEPVQSISPGVQNACLSYDPSGMLVQEEYYPHDDLRMMDKKPLLFSYPQYADSENFHNREINRVYHSDSPRNW